MYATHCLCRFRHMCFCEAVRKRYITQEEPASVSTRARESLSLHSYLAAARAYVLLFDSQAAVCKLTSAPRDSLVRSSHALLCQNIGLACEIAPRCPVQSLAKIAACDQHRMHGKVPAAFSRCKVLQRSGWQAAPTARYTWCGAHHCHCIRQRRRGKIHSSGYVLLSRSAAWVISLHISHHSRT